jgi:hypothetical protein
VTVDSHLQRDCRTVRALCLDACAAFSNQLDFHPIGDD